MIPSSIDRFFFRKFAGAELLYAARHKGVQLNSPLLLGLAWHLGELI